MKKRMTAILLSLCIILGMVSVAFAADSGGTTVLEGQYATKPNHAASITTFFYEKDGLYYGSALEFQYFEYQGKTELYVPATNLLFILYAMTGEPTPATQNPYADVAWAYEPPLPDVSLDENGRQIQNYSWNSEHFQMASSPSAFEMTYKGKTWTCRSLPDLTDGQVFVADGVLGVKDGFVFVNLQDLLAYFGIDKTVYTKRDGNLVYWSFSPFNTTEHNEWAKDAFLLRQAREYGLLTYAELSDLDAIATRLDLAEMLVSLGGLEITPPTDEFPFQFTDCDGLTEQEKNIIHTCILYGILSGMHDNTFGPDGTVPRAQIITCLHRLCIAIKKIEQDNDTQSRFEDCSPSMWFSPAVSALDKIGIFTVEGNNLYPNTNTTVRDMLRWAIAIQEYLAYGKVLTVSTSDTKSLSLKVGDGVTIGTQTIGSDYLPRFLWTSDNPTVATVDCIEIGFPAKVVALKQGTATITLQLANGNHVDYTVTVEESEKPTDISVDENITIAVGATQAVAITLTPADATAKYEVVSDNEHIVSAYTVSNGTGVEIKGVNPGTATITITTDNGLTKTALVKVGNDGDTPHNKDIEIPAIASSCTTVGYTPGYKCSVCDVVVIAPREIPMLEHHTEIRNAKSPTTAEAGYTGDEVCTVCNTVVKTGTAIPKLNSGGTGGGNYTPSNPTPATNSITTPKQDNGTITADTAQAKSGDKVTLTVSPDKGYKLSELKVIDRNGKEINCAANADGTYTFVMPNSKVEIKAVFVETPQIDIREAFSDINGNEWYTEAVSYVVNSGLMNGYGNGQFAPNNNLSRAMLAQILYNREGRPASDKIGNFTDVDGAAWYADAVSWAANNGIVSGYGDGKFGANDNITREQLAVMLWRYAGSPASSYEISGFGDSGTTSQFAVIAMKWAVENGVIHGDGQSLNPRGLATRAQVAQMLMNYFK